MAKEQIGRGLIFYQNYFRDQAGMQWLSATEAAQKFLPMLRRDWPYYVEEMEGNLSFN